MSGQLMELPAMYWGITTGEFRALIEECRRDPRWTRATSVRKLVEDHVKPMTAGTGMGYALLRGPDSVREISIMVSHSWNEPAEEFLEALERTVRTDDVLFICALSIFQNGDGSGPSIQEQIGDDSQESPFFLVLDQIAQRGAEFGWRWLPRLHQYRVSACLMSFALILQWLPLALCDVVYAFSGVFVWEDSTGLWQRTGWSPFCALVPGLSLIAFLVACAWAVLRIVGIKLFYEGRMVAVPNTEDDMYSRLWCVYEMHIALNKGIHVQLAPTMASAGTRACEQATCSSASDEDRIRNEIEVTVGYDAVDSAVRRVLSPQKWGWIRLKVAATALFIVGSLRVYSPLLVIMRSILVTGWGVQCWVMASTHQGRYSTVAMLRHLARLGAVLLGALSWYCISLGLHGGVLGQDAPDAALAAEIAKTMAGITAVQAVWFIADRLMYRMPHRSFGHVLIAFVVAAVGIASIDKHRLKMLTPEYLYLSAVSLFGMLLLGPVFTLSLWLLDRHWGVHWYPGADPPQKTAVSDQELDV